MSPTPDSITAAMAAARAAEAHPAGHQPAPEPAAVTPAVVPFTGELVDLRAYGPGDLADGLERAGDWLDDVYTFRQAVVDELARRADARGSRKVQLGPVTIEVNAPTVDNYDLEALEAALAPLVDDGTIAPELLDELIVQPPAPPAPARRVAKVKLNALLKSDDRRLLGALTSARRRSAQKRTARILERAVEANQ